MAKEKVQQKPKPKKESSKAEFSFTINPTKFLPNVSVAASIVPVNQNDAVYLIKSDGTDIWLYANTEDAALKIKCLGIEEVSGKGFFGFNFTMLKSILKGRTALKLSKNDSTVEVKATKGAYAVDFIALPHNEDLLESIDLRLKVTDKTGCTAIDDQLLAAIKEGLSVTALTAIHTVDPLDSFIKLHKGKLKISASDQFHLALFTQEWSDKKASISLSAPKNHFDVITKLSSEYKSLANSSKFYMEPDAIKVHNPFFRIALPSTQASDENFEASVSTVKELGTEDASFSVSKSKIINAIENITSVHEDGAGMQIAFVPKKGAIKVGMSTTFGKSSDALKVTDLKGDVELAVDPTLMLDLLAVAPSEVLVFKVLMDTGFVLDCTKATANGTYTVTYMGCILGDD